MGTPTESVEELWEDLAKILNKLEKLGEDVYGYDHIISGQVCRVEFVFESQLWEARELY